MQKFSLTDLTDHLQGPDGAQLHHKLIEQLTQLHAKADSSLKSGAKPAEFDEYEKIRSASASAINVLNFYMK